MSDSSDVLVCAAGEVMSGIARLLVYKSESGKEAWI